MSGVKIIFGGAGVQRDIGNFSSSSQASELFSVLKSYKVDTIDTAQLYGTSEELLGELDTGKQFTLDTKAFGGFKPGTATEESIVSEGRASLKRLGVSQVDVFYIHSPDASVPIESTLAGINTLYEEGTFKRFGLSNYKAEDVRLVYDHCKAHGYPLPTVYQGNYSAVARLQETKLFPLLRELGIAFYAYSPVAGGFLAKSKADIEGGAGRFNSQHFLSKMYSELYAKPALLEALEEWGAVADEVGVSRVELAYRWVAYNSDLKRELGDGIIFGGRTIEQVKETLEGLTRGPLPDSAVKRIDAIWEKVKHEAPLDNYNK